MTNRGNGSRGPNVGTIDWDEFHRLSSYQCTQREIANFFDIDVSTLENYYLDKYGHKLSEFWDKKKAHGRAKLKKIQWEQAENGSTAMAIFLGKQLLGQSDSPEKELMEIIDSEGLSIDQVIDLIKNRSKQAEEKGLVSFEEFCKKAGYPNPFEKQIEMMGFGFNNNVPRLLLGSRGYGKTDYVTILGTAYDVYVFGVSTSNLIITKSKTRNTALIEEISNALEANGLELEKSNSSCVRVKGLVGKDHSVEAITIRTSMRGRHPKRVIMDDPVTEEDVSAAMRAVVKRKYDEAYKLCSNLIVIGQPAHADDLYAELKPNLKKLEVPWGTIPELDADLEAMKLAGVDHVSIEMSYHLRVPVQGEMAFSNIQYVDQMPSGDAVAFIDPSDGGDYTAVSAIKGYMQGVAVEGRQWKRPWHHCVDEIVSFLRANNVRRVCFETNATGTQPIGQLREVLSPFNIGVVGKHSNSNKESAIMAAASLAHHIHLSKKSESSYTKHVVKYTTDQEHDDAPDSLARGLEWIGLIRGKK